ncbi:MAG: hypothetical protein HY928_05270 [Elusimicrobia bacterium]|nr:hypothetical protein [Elusimicrobiota bacterium]
MLLPWLLAAALCAAQEGPALRQGALADSAGRRAAAGFSAESAAAGARAAFGEPAPAPVFLKTARFSPAAPAELRLPPEPPALKTPPPALAAKAYAAEDEDGPKFPPFGTGWDRAGTLKAASFGLAGALIGFLLGGPIGAAAGFLAGFFIGAALWKAAG